MKNPFNIGDVRTYSRIVTAEDSASFGGNQIHPVYSTFALTRDAEWSGRLFVLDMKEEGEEGIGSGITVRHLSPALIGQEVVFTATLKEVNGNEVITDYTVKMKQRLIAEGTQWQKIVSKERLDRLFEVLK
jgi:fluoroacetyl-CoA thioesterase